MPDCWRMLTAWWWKPSLSRGQVVSAGQVVIRLARAGQREARVQLPETVRPAVGSEALATRYGSESQPVTATLRLLSDAADATTRTLKRAMC